jgi:hypothetical protein
LIFTTTKSHTTAFATIKKVSNSKLEMNIGTNYTNKLNNGTITRVGAYAINFTNITKILDTSFEIDEVIKTGVPESPTARIRANVVVYTNGISLTYYGSTKTFQFDRLGK